MRRFLLGLVVLCVVGSNAGAQWGRVGSDSATRLTRFGREAGIEAGMSLADFQARIPPRTYEQFAPWIERMKRGEADVLWPGRCAYYAISSGTTAGRTKYLPVTPEMIAHFRQTGLDSLCLYARRTGSTAAGCARMPRAGSRSRSASALRRASRM